MRKIVLYLACIIIIFPALGNGQVGLEVGLNAGSSHPMGTFKREFNFANSGYSFNADVDYFFGVIGFGISAGVASNESHSAFEKYMNARYTYDEYSMAYENWLAKYIVFGPSLRLGFGKLQLIGYGKLGFLNLSVPTINFQTQYFDQSYQAMKYWGDVDNIMGVWFGGVKGQYRFNPNVSFQLKGELITTKFFSGIKNSMIYRDARDANQNGLIDDTEYFEANDRLLSNDVIYSNLFLSAGLSINVGGVETTNSIYSVQHNINNPYYMPSDLPLIDIMEVEEEKMDSLQSEKIDEFEKIVVVKPVEKVVPPDSLEILKLTKGKSGEEANNLLFQAGKSYLEQEQFDDALFCFNKLSDSKDYPLATFYEALTYLKMDKCREGEMAYARFRVKYPHENTTTIQELYKLIRRLCKEEKNRSNLETLDELEEEPMIVEKEEIKEVKPERETVIVQDVEMMEEKEISIRPMDVVEQNNQTKESDDSKKLIEQEAKTEIIRNTEEDKDSVDGEIELVHEESPNADEPETISENLKVDEGDKVTLDFDKETDAVEIANDEKITEREEPKSVVDNITLKEENVKEDDALEMDSETSDVSEIEESQNVVDNMSLSDRSDNENVEEETNINGHNPVEEVASDSVSKKVDEVAETVPSEVIVEEKPTTAKENNVSYRIQFIALNRDRKRYKNVEKIGKVEKEYFDQMKKYRYMLGPYSDLEEARNDMYQVRRLGFKDAFIAIYQGSERIVTFYHPE